MICYHGTTKNGLRAILDNVGYKPTGPWSCSDNDGAMYLWPTNKLVEQYDFEDDSQMICHAFESAEIQAVVADETEIFVVVLDVPDQYLEDDYSCENMYNVASYIPISRFSKSMIQSVYKAQLNKWNAPFVISGLLRMELFNKYSISEGLLAVAEVISKSEVYRDPTEYNYQAIDFNKE